MKHIRVSLANLKPGMQVADDVYNQNYQLILPKGVVITEQILPRLVFYGIKQVPVFCEKASSVAPDTPAGSDSGKTHAQRVRESSDFLQYSDAFYEAKDHFQYTLTDIAERDTYIDVNQLFETTADILKHARTSYQVFDMLHNMRHFDDSTFAHSLNVSIICNIMGKWLHMPESEIRLLTVSGLLHDIGKLLVPPEIITKPDKLTADEYAIIQTHSRLGYDLLSKQDLDPRVALVALCHHEKYDGSGYPLHISGAKIPAFARIVCIVDIYEAMTADRVYRKGICPFEVIRQFESEGFRKYDAEYVLTFLKGIAQTYMYETVLLNNEEQGEIVMINENALSRPMLRTSSGFLNLAKEPDLKIVQIL